MNTFTRPFNRPLSTALIVGFAIFLSAEANATAITWTGAQNTNYSNPNNWNPQTVPSAGDDVTIPGGIRSQPTVDAVGFARNLTINSGATLTLIGASVLNFSGNIVDDGSLGGPGAIVAVGTALQTISGSGGGLNNGATGPININDLMIQNTAGVTLSHTMTIQRRLALGGNLNTIAARAANLLTLLSNATGTAFVVNTPIGNDPNVTYVVNGNVTVQRYIDGFLNQGLGYRHYSSPVANSTILDLTTPGFTPEVSAGAAYNSSTDPQATTPFPTVYEYDQSRVVDASIDYFNGVSNIDRGYKVPNPALSTSAPLEVTHGYAVNIASTEVVDFVGSLNNGIYTRVLDHANTGTPADIEAAGWHLLGNPYPAPLNFSVLAPPPGTNTPDLVGIDAAIYVVKSTDQYGSIYRSYMSNIDLVNPTVPVGQGFFVHVTTPGVPGTITFRNTQRLTNTDNTPFQRTTINHPQVNLSLTSSATTAIDDVLSIYFENGSTNGVEPRYDAIKLLNSTGLNLSSLASTGQALSIDGRPMPTGQLTVPLQVYVPTNGTYTLGASQMFNMTGMNAYLRDIQTGALINLAQQPNYTFSMNAANTTPRFELVFSARALAATAPASLTQQVSVYPNPAKGAVSVELPASLGRQSLTATLTDALGRTVRTNTLPAQGTAVHQLSLSGVAAGVYSLQLRTDAGLVVKRLVIE